MDEELQNAEPDAWDIDLRHKERLFVLHYCTDAECLFNATASYKAVYTKTNRVTGQTTAPAQGSCEVGGSRFLRRPRVRTAVRRLLRLVQTELDEESGYKVLRDVARLALYNPADIITSRGKLKCRSLDELGENAKAIEQIVPAGKTVSVKLADRSKYIALLLRYLELVRPETVQEVVLPVVEITPKVEEPDTWNKIQEDRDSEHE